MNLRHKLAIVSAIFCALVASLGQAQTTTTFTGTIQDLTGAAVSSGNVVFTLQPGADTTVSGSARFTPQTVTCGINGSGVLQNATLSGNCVVTNNTALTPAGTSWQVQICPAFACTSSFVTYALGGTVNITTATPTPSQMPAYSLVDIFQNQSVGGNKTFTGLTTLSGGAVASSFESVLYADQCSGADIGAKINTCYAALPSRTVTDTYFSSITVPYGTIVVPAGVYSFSTSIVIGSPFVNIVGQGMTATSLNYTGSGTALRFNPNANINEFISGNGLFELSIDGANASAGAVGLETSDFSGFRLNDVVVRNFSGTGSIGWLDDAIHLYNEKMNISRLSLENNKVSWEINPQATCFNFPNCSFGYGIFDVSILTHQGQTGFLQTNGFFSNAIIKMTVNQVDTPANATAIQLQNSAQWGPNTYMIEIESPGGIGTGHEISISSSNTLPFTGVGALSQGAMSSNITGVTENGNTQYFDPQQGLFWPIFSTAGSTTGFNPVFRLDPNAPNQTRQNVIDVEATAPSSYQRNQWPTASGQIANLNAAGTWTANQTFSLNCPSIFLQDTTNAQSTPNKTIAACNGEFHIANSALSTNILKLTDAGNLTVTGTLNIAGSSTVNAIYNGSSTLTYTAISAQTGQEQTMTITGASTTNFGVFCSPRASLGNTNLAWSAWVSATNTISVRVLNPTTGAITPSAVAWGCTVNQ